MNRCCVDENGIPYGWGKVLDYLEIGWQDIPDTSLDSFISGFELAWQLSAELNHYENERPVLCQTAEKPGARFAYKKEEET